MFNLIQGQGREKEGKEGKERKEMKERKERKERKDEGEEMHTKERKRCSQQEYRDRSHEGKSVKERVSASVSQLDFSPGRPSLLPFSYLL